MRKWKEGNLMLGFLVPGVRKGNEGTKCEGEERKALGVRWGKKVEGRGKKCTKCQKG